LAFFSACTRASTFSCSAISDRSRSSAVSRLFRAAICRRMSSPFGDRIVSVLVEAPCRSWPEFWSEATPRLYKIAPEGENRKSNVGSSRLPEALASKHAEPYRLSSPRPPQCGALWPTARLLTFRLRNPPAPPLTGRVIEGFGSTSLVKDGNNYFLSPNGGSADPRPDWPGVRDRVATRCASSCALRHLCVFAPRRQTRAAVDTGCENRAAPHA
jgi:hypothetical protein